MKLGTMALIAAGYVLGAKAGHERYEQITASLETAAERLEAFSARTGGTAERPADVHGTSRSSRASR